MSHNSFVGVVMAGGKSRRMGTNKAELTRVGQTMTEFTAECLMRAKAEQIIVSLPYGEDTSNLEPFQIQSIESRPLVSKIADSKISLGPLGGILTVLQHSVAKGITLPHLFVPVDLPLLNPETLMQLAEHDLGDDDAVTFHRQPLPVMIKPSQILVDKLTAIIEAADNLSMYRFLDCIDADAIKLNDVDGLFNSNKPEEWQIALAKI